MQELVIQGGALGLLAVYLWLQHTRQRDLDTMQNKILSNHLDHLMKVYVEQGKLYGAALDRVGKSMDAIKEVVEACRFVQDVRR